MPTFVWNRYKDITISPSSLYTNIEQFNAQMTNALALWTKQHVNGVWLKLPLRMAHLVPSAIALGFSNHHSTPLYFMFTKWLAGGEPKFPGYGTHLARVEAIVTREHDGCIEYLMVKELYNSRTKRWNFVNGTCKLAEFLADAVRREVREEVGIEVEVKSIIGLGDRTCVKFGHSEALICFHCIPIDDDAPLIPQRDEISRAAWINDPRLHRDVEKVWHSRCAGGLENLIIHDRRGYPSSLHCYHA